MRRGRLVQAPWLHGVRAAHAWRCKTTGSGTPASSSALLAKAPGRPRWGDASGPMEERRQRFLGYASARSPSPMVYGYSTEMPFMPQRRLWTEGARQHRRLRRPPFNTATPPDPVSVGHGSGGGLNGSLRKGRRPSMAATRRSMAAAAHRRIRKRDDGGRLRRCGCSSVAQKKFSSGVKAAAIARRCSCSQWQRPPSSIGAAVPAVWWMLQRDSRRCGVAAAIFALRHGRPPDGPRRWSTVERRATNLLVPSRPSMDF